MKRPLTTVGSAENIIFSRGVISRWCKWCTLREWFDRVVPYRVPLLIASSSWLSPGKLEERVLQAGQQQAERHQYPGRVQETPLRALLLPRKRAGRTCSTASSFNSLQKEMFRSLPFGVAPRLYGVVHRAFLVPRKCAKCLKLALVQFDTAPYRVGPSILASYWPGCISE